MLEIIFCAKQELITRARLRVQDFATGKNFSSNQCHYKEFCVFFSRKSCYNCLEFSQPLEYLYQAMQTRKSFLLLKWYNFYSFKIFPRF